MAKSKQPKNPFYAVLLVVGVIFAITACAYCVMAFRAVTGEPPGQVSTSGEGLMRFLDQYGMWIMLAEITVLAVATVGAIGTDRYWIKRGNKSTFNHDAPAERAPLSRRG